MIFVFTYSLFVPFSNGWAEEARKVAVEETRVAEVVRLVVAACDAGDDAALVQLTELVGDLARNGTFWNS